MKTITETELKNILAEHKLWFDGKGGNCANLQGADLQGTNLQGANLYRADLQGADLRGADLRGANLYRADLTGADLRGADLTGADLTGTILEKNKSDKQPEVGSVKSESTIRSEFEALAKKHGLHITCLEFKMI